MVGTPGAIQQPPASAGVYGQGIAWPPTIDQTTGRLKLSWGEQSVVDAIGSICRTQPGERVMLPGYGGASVTFEPVDPARMQLAIEGSISAYEARVERVSVVVEVTPDGSPLAVVTIKPIASANEQTLTYPIFSPPTGSP